MDDIVIFSDTWEEHLKRLQNVLFQLMEFHGVGTPKPKSKALLTTPFPKLRKV